MLIRTYSISEHITLNIYYKYNRLRTNRRITIMTMVNVGIKVIFLLLLIVAVPFSNIERHQSWAFESRQLSLPKSKGMSSYLQSKRRSPTDHDCKIIGRDDNDDDPNNIDLQDSIISKPTTKRRKILLSSVAAFITTIIASSGTPKVAEASSLAGLEDTEKRRIEVFQRNAPSVVYIDVIAERQDVFSPNAVDERIGTGSGFVWDKDGHIVTNFHVVRNSKFAQVALITPRRNSNNKIIPDDNGPLSVSSSTSQDVFLPVRTSSTNKVSTDDYKRTVFKARIIGVDPGKDIAVLKIDAPEEILYPIQVGKSLGLIVGQTALAIGNPFGLDHTLTSGVISGLGREVKSPIGRPITNVIQTDAAINPGNSGGVLLDSGGKLIGMNTAIYSPTGASAGIGFAIPIDTIKYIVNTLIKDGKVVRSILGISFLESKQAQALGIGRGVLVLGVPAGSPAAKAGLRGTKRTETGLVEIGDIIVQVGDVMIETEANLFQALETYKPGDVASVKVSRIDAVDDKLLQRELILKIELQSSEVFEDARYFKE